MHEDIRRPYPVAITAPGKDSVVADAIAWVLHASHESGGIPLVFVADENRVRGSAWLRAFVADAGLPVATAPDPNWRGGVVLAAWPRAEQLAAIAADPRTRGLCVVPDDLTEVGVWAESAHPHLLGSTAPPECPAPLDPVIAEALTTLSGLVNPSGTLAGLQARRDAVALLVIAHEGGHRGTREQIYAWSLAHGWSARAARRLAALAAHVAGRRPAAPAGPFRSDILGLWRDRAAARPHGCPRVDH
ncbi:hypothetical protein AB0H71_32365 [Nocardia sp. NPDC050697]|uniref:hypothetical protein n=1 Tax=Nocardia sp. NPDC050697 TaxID=3155158 RepID=UPI0034109688